MTTATTPLIHTPLYDLHMQYGARMVPFAGHALPVQYAQGLLQEHHHTRQACSVFDVSHMGQIRITGRDAAALIERLAPTDACGLAVGRQRYALLLAEDGGILDDLMFARLPDVSSGADKNAMQTFALVVNGAVRDADWAHIQAVAQSMQHAQAEVQVEAQFDRALLAVQGPQAEVALAAVLPLHAAPLAAMRFMDVATFNWQGHTLLLSRSGYSGEDGFEIALPAPAAVAFTQALLQQPGVALAGLGARNSLRLEAGLCLYGQDMDRQHTVAETDLGWTVPKVRRSGGARAGGFIGDTLTLAQLEGRAALQSLRIALVGQERVPLREGTPIVAVADDVAPQLGLITSSVLSPSLGQALAFARVDAAAYAALASDAPLYARQRGKYLPLTRQHGAFVATRYKRA